MSSAFTRLYVAAYSLVLVWLFALVAAAAQPALIATAAGVALALTAAIGLHAMGVLRSPAPKPALIAIRRRDGDRRRSVVCLADPDASGRPRPRAPGGPFAG